MRFEIIENCDELFENAIISPSLTKESIQKFYLTHLQNAKTEKLEVIDFRSIPMQDTASKNFQYISLVEDIIVSFLRENDYPSKIRIICNDKEMSNQYKFAYNFYFATNKDTRLNI